MEPRTNTAVLDPAEGPINFEEQCALLERVAASVPLKRAARLREFLLYVGHQTLRNNSADIHEQEIGSEVFGRSSGYDTSQDNIVRVNATELRKRIEIYFTAEGAGETLVLEIPRGSYKPVFRRRILEVEPLPVLLPEDAFRADLRSTPGPVPSERPGPRTLSSLWSVLAVLLLVAVCLALALQNRAMRKDLYAWNGNPALSTFWPAFFNPPQQTDIILADTSIALIEDITRRPVTLNDYLNRSYVNQIDTSQLSPDRREDLNMIASRNNGSVGDFHVAKQILLLDRTTKSLHLQFARDYSPDSFKRNNVILVGSRKSNPWVEIFNGQLNFTIEYDGAHQQSFVANRNPGSSEQATYFAPVDPYASIGYSVIAYLPNPSHTANAIIVSGTNSEATNAAGEFLTSEESLEKLRRTLQAQKFPYFEVLLKTTHLSGTPFSAEIVAYRTYPNPH